MKEAKLWFLIFYTTFCSDSSLTILLSVLLTLKLTALCDLENLCPIMQQRVLLRGITMYLIEARDYLNK